MGELLSVSARHGYGITFLVVFLEAIGLPVPAALVLIAAGAASAWGTLRPEVALAVAVSAMLLGDLLLFILGRYTGWWLLGLLCRVAANPETCILRSAESFYRRGRLTLVIAKFLPGVNTMAPPLAGSMKMGLRQFLQLDFAGSCLYALAFGGLGFLFSGFIVAITEGLHAVSRAIGWLILAGVIVYIGYRVRLYWKRRIYRVVPRIQVEELVRKLNSLGAEKVLMADVRSHGYYDAGASRIRGSIRLEPNNLPAAMNDLPRDKEIYLYCT